MTAPGEPVAAQHFSAGPALTPRERLMKARSGEAVDRPPISFWQHFPAQDHDPRLLARATVDFQNEYELDLVKLMPSGMYSVVDYGVATGQPDPVTGARARVGGSIETMADVAAVARHQGLGSSVKAELEAAERVRQELSGDVPVIETIFSPLTMLAKLSPAPLAFTLIELGERSRQVLDKLAEDVVAFGQASLRAGVDGFFYATQWANHALVDDAIYDEYGVGYDEQILRALRPDASVIMLHLHGSLPRFELAGQLPVDWVNWEDRDSVPSLAGASRTPSVGLAAGLPRDAAPYTDDHIEHACARYVDDAVVETEGARLLLAPGCVMHQNVGPTILSALRRTVDGYAAANGER
jgi:uroporphyrinogen decarboxylase